MLEKSHDGVEALDDLPRKKLLNQCAIIANEMLTMIVSLRYTRVPPLCEELYKENIQTTTIFRELNR